jgi:hypothetical protein
MRTVGSAPDSDSDLVGRVGTLVLGCRGPAGPGEVQLSIRGGREWFTAFCDIALPAGAQVLVIEAIGNRSVTVVSWDDAVRSRPLD